MIQRAADAIPDCRLPGDEPNPVYMTGNVLVEFDVSFVVTIDEGDECTDEQSMLDVAYETCKSHLSVEPDPGVDMEYWTKPGFPKRE